MAGVLKKVRRPEVTGGLRPWGGPPPALLRRGCCGALGPSAPRRRRQPEPAALELGSGLGPGLAWVGGFAFSQRGGRAEFKQREPCFVFEQTTGLVGLAVCESPHEVGAPAGPAREAGLPASGPRRCPFAFFCRDRFLPPLLLLTAFLWHSRGFTRTFRPPFVISFPCWWVFPLSIQTYFHPTSPQSLPKSPELLLPAVTAPCLPFPLWGTPYVYATSLPFLVLLHLKFLFC